MNVTSEEGSIAPLALGLAILSAATILVTAVSTSVYLHERRLVSLAESMAIANTEQDLSVDSLRSLLAPSSLRIASVKQELLSDGSTNQVTVCANWNPPFFTPWTASQVMVCGKAQARSGD